MTFTQLIFRNMIRNYSLYLAYFFSCVLSVLSFFVYTIFIFHPQLSNRVVLQNAVDWMYGASSLIYIFAIGFILYSIRIFLQNRQQEFDIWFTQGMSIKQFRMMIFYENVYIGIGSIAIGIICGISIEKLFLLINSNIMGISPLAFYFPGKAIVFTIVVYTLLFAILAYGTPFLIKHKKSHFDVEQNKYSKNTRIFLSLLSIVLLLYSYYLSCITTTSNVLTNFFLILFLIGLGTYFFYTQVIPNLITFAQKKLSWYWKKTNVIGTTHLLRSWNKYSFLFVVITIIYTASFCTLGTLASSQALNKQFQFDYPLAVGYIAKDKNKIHERHLLQIHHELKKRKIHYTTYQAKIKFVSLRSSKEKVPRPIPILSYTDYQNMVMQSKQKLIVHPLKANEAMALLTSQLDSYPIQETYESKNTTIKLVQKTVSSNVTIPWRLLQSQPLVVSDTMFASMPSHSIATFTGFYSKDALTKTIGLGKTLVHEGRIMPSDQKPYSMIVSGTLYQNQIHLLRSLFFIMFLVGLVTFIASGSFIYFQLQSDIKTEADRYNILQKIGLTNEKWNKTVCWRLAVLFFLPITVAAIHSVFAMVVLQKYFLVSIVSQWLTVIAAFILGQTLYFLLIYTRYIQDVKNYS